MIFNGPIQYEAGSRPYHRTEYREGLPYTDLALEQALERAETNIGMTLTAAVESCAGLWERGFASATCRRLSAPQLALIGRELLKEGEVVMYKEKSRIVGVAASHSVLGRTSSPLLWRYKITPASPQGKQKAVEKSGTDVFHLRIGTTKQEPWRGVSPLHNAQSTSNILKAVELAMRYEAGGSVATIIPVPKPSTELANDLRNARGKTVLGHTTSQNWGEGGRGPAGDWRPQRVAPTFSEHEIGARAAVERSIASACGVPPILLGLDAGGGDAREAWRQFAFSTLRPIGSLIEYELERIGLPAPVSFSKLGASDIGTRSRAWKQLVDAGMDKLKAEGLAGLGD